MPQMMPLNWLMMFFYMIMLFLTFKIIIYFNFLNKTENKTKMIYKMNLNWKW